jgi:peptide/nickel transport system permease protein
VASVAIGVPEFVLAILLIALLGVNLRLLPVGGYAGGWAHPGVWLSHMIIPIIALSVPIIASLFRQLRSDLSEALQEDFVRACYAKGLTRRWIVVKHALRAAAAPSLTLIGVQIPRLMGGTFIIESIFQLPGLGLLTVDSTLNKDLPVIDGIVPLLVAAAILGNLFADIATTWVNPRLRAAR